MLVYSIHHMETARLTQASCDRDGVVRFRQSRLLDICSETPLAPDILLLLRWMGWSALGERATSGPTNEDLKASATMTADQPFITVGEGD